MRFSFEFVSADDGGVLEVFLDDNRVYVALSKDYVGHGQQHADWIDVARFAGKHMTLSYRLSNAIEGRHGVVALDDLIFAHIGSALAPIANAGPDQTVRQGNLVTLNGSGSIDPENGTSPLTFQWNQSAGPSVTLTGGTTATPGFTPTTVGSYQFDLIVNNGQESSSPDSVAVNVIYDFKGFFPPVDNLPVLNQVKAGQGVPVKFSLSGDQGLNIFAAGYPVSQAIACSTGSTDAIEQTVTAGSSSLSYDPTTDQYTYVWKTNKGWVGTCRQLIVKLNDGTEHRANFGFK